MPPCLLSLRFASVLFWPPLCSVYASLFSTVYFSLYLHRHLFSLFHRLYLALLHKQIPLFTPFISGIRRSARGGSFPWMGTYIDLSLPGLDGYKEHDSEVNGFYQFQIPPIIPITRVIFTASLVEIVLYYFGSRRSLFQCTKPEAEFNFEFIPTFRFEIMQAFFANAHPTLLLYTLFV